MPQMPQDDLTPLTASILLFCRPDRQPPLGYPNAQIPALQTVAKTTRMTYQGSHLWFADGHAHITSAASTLWWYYLRQIDVDWWLTVWLDWANNRTEANGRIDYSFNAVDDNYFDGFNFSVWIDTYENVHPWDTGWQTELRSPWNDQYNWRATRILPQTNPLLPLIRAFAASPTVHGNIDECTLEEKPIYPEGAIPGVTPPTDHVLLMRRRPTGVIYSDPGHAALRAAFASAASQWAALTQPQQALWNRAGRTTRPKLSGYSLWSQIIATKRLDRCNTLSARLGQTLQIPELPS